MTEMDRVLAEVGAQAEAADDDGTLDYVPVAPPTDPSQVYSVRIPVRRVEQLRHLAAARGTKPTALLRQWVIERLEQETAPSPVAGPGATYVYVTMAPPPDQPVHRRLDDLDATIREALAANTVTFGG